MSKPQINSLNTKLCKTIVFTEKSRQVLDERVANRQSNSQWAFDRGMLLTRPIAFSYDHDLSKHGARGDVSKFTPQFRIPLKSSEKNKFCARLCIFGRPILWEILAFKVRLLLTPIFVTFTINYHNKIYTQVNYGTSSLWPSNFNFQNGSAQE